MKKIALGLFTIVFMTSVSQAQSSEFDKWSVSYAFGSHLWTKPSSNYKANLRNFHISHHNINGRYMFNNRIGLMLDFSYDNFEFAKMKQQKTHHLRTSFQLVVNAGDILKLNTIGNRLGLLVHAGAGHSIMWQTFPSKSQKDNMVNLIGGITPQIRIAPRWSVKADASLIFNYSQNVTYDFQRQINDINKSLYLRSIGFFANLSVGVTYHIGKNKNHLDWVPTFYSIGGQTIRSPRY